MAIIFPDNRDEIFQRAQADTQAELQTVNTFTRNNLLASLLAALAGRTFAFYKTLRSIINNAIFPNNATGVYLTRWGNLRGLSKTPATRATGVLNINGTTIHTQIPAGTSFFTDSGELIVSTALATVYEYSYSITSLTRVGTTATAVTSSAHGLATGQTVTIAGAGQAAYNGLVTITVVNATTFTFTVSGSPTTPATGSPSVAAKFAKVSVQANTFGSLSDLFAGAEITLSSTIANIDDSGFMQSVVDGVDEEEEKSFQERVTFAYQNPISLFNKAAIETTCKAVAGVTRVFVQEITPAVGQVTIYFLRDNDTDSIFPSSEEIAKVKTAIDNIKPAHVASADIFVNAPSAVSVSPTIANLTPNTSTMRAAIQKNLEEYFLTEVEVGQDIYLNSLIGVIYRTTDSTTGESVQNFTLSAPIANVVVSNSQIGTLGTVTFS